MRALLILSALSLFVGYSAIAMATGGSASFVASPLLVIAIGCLVAHDKLDTAKNHA